MTQLLTPRKIPFENDVPIDEPLIVLDLLYREWGTPTDRVLWNWDDEPPHVELGWYCGGYTKDLHSKSYYFLVDPWIVGFLRKGYVKGTPKWGYTDQKELRITDAGIEALHAAWKVVGEIPRSEKWLERRRWQ